MKKLEIKKPRALNPVPAIKKHPSKPKKTKLSKNDPLYFSKIGAISAKKRKLTSADYSAMAKASHPRSEYKGGRPKKVSEE
jgi:hypothetical protein